MGSGAWPITRRQDVPGDADNWSKGWEGVLSHSLLAVVDGHLFWRFFFCCLRAPKGLPLLPFPPPSPARPCNFSP